MLKMEGICLNDDELNSVYTSTEGWISALWIQISNYKQTGSFDNTSDIDYLVETAIWNRLTPEQKNCLVTLSVMDRFTARQAAFLLGEETLPDHIKDFLKYNDFIRYYPRERIYVMHNILQNFSRNQFYQYQPEAFQKRVLRAAGQCCIAEGDFYSAMRFFFKLRDFDALLSTPFDVIYILNRRENNIIEFLKEVINECPDEILCKYPFVMLMLSYVFQIDGEYESYQKLCHLLDFVLNSNPAGLCKDELQQLMGEFLLLKSFTIYNDLKKVNEMQKAALKLLGESSRFSLNEVPITLGAKSVLGMFWREPGKLDETLADMQRYLPYHSKLTCGQGTGADCALQAEMMLMRGDYISAETLCYKALYQARSKNEICICLCVELILAQISIMRGDVDGFFTIIKNIKDYARENSKLYILRMIDICLSVISVVLGTTDMVAKWLFDAESIRKNVYYRAVPYVNTIYLYLLIRENRYAELLGMVDNTITMAKEMNYILPQVYCLVLKARVCYASGKESEALESLEEAFALALPDKIYMPFVQFTYMGDILSKAYFGPTTWTCSVTFSILSNYGEVKNPAPLSKGFESILGWKTDIDNIMSLFDRFHKGRIKILNALNRVNSPLTPREREVAILAKSRLSNKEIAEKLYISPATVRTILYNAYNKLGIHSRSQLFKIDF